MRVGFIGIGNIGKPMAEQVVRAGHELVVHDLNRDAAESLVAEGAVWAESPSEVAAECDVVCTCLPGPNEVEPLVLSGGGIAASIRPGSVYVDHTTNAPSLVRRISDLLATKGVDTLDAPVSGGMEGARTRDLVMLVGGDAAVVEKVRPVLDSMAKTVMHVGDVGAGCVCKLAHNCAGFSINLAMVECMTLAVKAGVDPTTLVNVFQRPPLAEASTCRCGCRQPSFETGRHWPKLRPAGAVAGGRLRAPVRPKGCEQRHEARHRAGAVARHPDEVGRGVRRADVGSHDAWTGGSRQLRVLDPARRTRRSEDSDLTKTYPTTRIPHKGSTPLVAGVYARTVSSPGLHTLERIAAPSRPQMPGEGCTTTEIVDGVARTRS